MFDNKFRAFVKKMQPKRASLAKGGELSVDIDLSAPLTTEMATALGYDLDSILNTEMNISKITGLVIDESSKGLIVDAWNITDDYEQTTEEPYMSLQGLSMHNYTLTSDDDTKTVFFNATLKSGPITEADIVRVVHLLGYDSLFQIEYAQGELPL